MLSFVALLYGLGHVVFERWAVGPIDAFHASLLGGLLDIAGIPTRVQGDRIASARFTMEFIPECTAWNVFAIYAAAVLAFPVSLRKRAIGLISGLPAIFVFNQVRLVGLFLIGIHRRGDYELIHLHILQPTVVAFTLGVFLWWSQSTSASRPGSAPR